jgi:predicted transcriptional regulator
VNEALVELTADIVAAYVSHNVIPISDLPVLIQNVHGCLAALGATEAVEIAPQLPAVSIRASIKPDYLVCLEDGKKMKLLKGYLKRVYGLSPSQYRERWNLPADYPMVAPAYTARRRELALEIGLGRANGVAAQKPAPPASKRGRKAPAPKLAKAARPNATGKLSLRLGKSPRAAPA